MFKNNSHYKINTVLPITIQRSRLNPKLEESLSHLSSTRNEKTLPIDRGCTEILAGGVLKFRLWCRASSHIRIKTTHTLDHTTYDRIIYVYVTPADGCTHFHAHLRSHTHTHTLGVNKQHHAPLIQHKLELKCDRDQMHAP